MTQGSEVDHDDSYRMRTFLYEALRFRNGLCVRMPVYGTKGTFTATFSSIAVMQAVRQTFGGSYLGAVEVQVRTGWRGAALVLVPGAVDGGAVRVLGGGAGAEQA